MITRNLLFGFMLLLGCISCSEDDPSHLTYPEIPAEADITGQVKLFDEGLTPLGNADMTIRIDGLDISAKTDAEGNFTLPDIPFGTYNLVYEKPGYGTYKKFALIHSPYINYGKGTVIEGTTNLGQLASTRVTDLSVEVIGTDLVLTVTTDPQGSVEKEGHIRYFYGSTQYFGEDFEIGESPYDFWHSEMIATQSNPQVITIPLAEFGYLSDWGYYLFNPGEEVTIRVFGDSYYDNRYYDPYLEKNVSPNLNPTAADQVSFIVP